MTITTSFARAASACLGASLAAVLLIATAPASAQSTFLPCTFTDADVAGLRNKIATAVGINSNFVATPIIIVPTFNPDLGQQATNGGNPSSFTKMVICTNSGTVGSVTTATTESDPFPSGTAAASILEINQTSYVLIERNSQRQIKICHTDQESACLEGTRQ